MIWYPPPPSSHFPKLLILESLIGALYSGVDTFKVSSSWINFDSTACECLSRVTPLYNLVQWDDFKPSMPWRSASVKRDFWSVQLFNPFFRQMILRYDIFCRKIASRYFLPEGKRVNGNNFYCYKNLTHQKFSVTTTYTFSSRKKGETAAMVSLLYYCKCWNTRNNSSEYSTHLPQNFLEMSFLSNEIPIIGFNLILEGNSHSGFYFPPIAHTFCALKCCWRANKTF